MAPPSPSPQAPTMDHHGVPDAGYLLHLPREWTVAREHVAVMELAQIIFPGLHPSRWDIHGEPSLGVLAFLRPIESSLWQVYLVIPSPQANPPAMPAPPPPSPPAYQHDMPAPPPPACHHVMTVPTAYTQPLMVAHPPPSPSGYMLPHPVVHQPQAVTYPPMYQAAGWSRPPSWRHLYNLGE